MSIESDLGLLKNLLGNNSLKRGTYNLSVQLICLSNIHEMFAIHLLGLLIEFARKINYFLLKAKENNF